MDAPVALYQLTAYEAPVEVQLLIYQEAIQLYYTQSGAFLTSIAFKQVSHFTEENENVIIHFKSSEDVKLVLEDDHPLLPEIIKAGKKKKMKPGAKVAILTASVIGGILLLNYIFSLVVADIGLKIISPEYETKLGEEMFSSTVPQTLVDERRTAIIQNFADKLKLSDKYPIQVTVLRAKDVNAFAIPGGNIVVFTGLLDRMQSYDELVALLGHEASHINERHTTRAMLRGISTKLFLIFFMDVSQLGGIILLNADKLRDLSYSRSLEQEADEEGLKIMQRNKVDMNGMLKMFDRLKAADTVGTPVFLNTHPLTEKRIRYTRENIKDAHQADALIDPILQEIWQKLQKKEEPEAGIVE